MHKNKELRTVVGAARASSVPSLLCAGLVGSLAFAGVAIAQTTPLPNAPREDWLALFNGTDLTGWTPKIRGYAPGENFGNTFRVVDGLLTVSYDAYDK